MNCQGCQERLDERLDDLRAPLQRGESSEWARAQAAIMLEEVAGECPDCAAELRAHVAVRLALMAPVAAPAVPPMLRANVRRALEREAPARRGNVRGGAAGRWGWAGGALASAALLFVVARPFLVQRAEAPLPLPASDAAPPAAPKPPNASGAGTMNAGNQGKKAPDKPAPTALKTASPMPKSAAPLPKFNAAPPPFVAPRAESVMPLPRTLPRNNEQLAPPVVVPAARQRQPIASPVGGAGQGRVAIRPGAPANAALSPAKQQAPFLSAPRALKPTEVPGIPASPFSEMKGAAPRMAAPMEPRLEAKLLAPTGRALGLRVALETAPVGAMAGRAGALESPAAPASALPAPASESARSDAPLVGAGGGVSVSGTARGAASDTNRDAAGLAAPDDDTAPALAQSNAGALMRTAPPAPKRGAAKSGIARAPRQKMALSKTAVPRAASNFLVSGTCRHGRAGRRENRGPSGRRENPVDGRPRRKASGLHSPRPPRARVGGCGAGVGRATSFAWKRENVGERDGRGAVKVASA